MRRALVVALGLLGAPVRPAGVILDPRDPGDAAAWVVGLVLGGPREAPARLAADAGAFGGAAAEVVALARTRLALGHALSVVG